MKNIMVVDDLQDYFYDVHAVSDVDFARIFPEPGQNVEFHDDLYARPDLEALNDVFHRVWFGRIRHGEAAGLHGLLFYENWDRKPFYRGKRDIADGSDDVAIGPDDRIVVLFDREAGMPIRTCRAGVALFGRIFAGGTDVEFVEDLRARLGARDADEIVATLASRPIAKSRIPRIDGTLYAGYPDKRMYFVTKVDADIPRHYPLSS